MDILKELDATSMVEVLEGQMARLLSVGNADMERLQKEVEHDPKDPTMWFDLGVAVNQAGLQYGALLIEKTKLELAALEETEEGESACEEQAECPTCAGQGCGAAQGEEEVTITVDNSAAMPLFERSVECFKKVLELEPEYYGCHTQMGTVYANMQRLEEAVVCFQKALEEDDEDFSAVYYLACAYRDLDNAEQAEALFKRAEELSAEGIEN